MLPIRTINDIRLNAQSSIPLNIQVREQIRWLIGSGDLKPGDSLPPAGELAQRLGLNRNTINSVYAQLQDDGILVGQKGKGTKVKGGDTYDKLTYTTSNLQSYLKNLMKDAVSAEYNLDSLVMAGFTYIQLYSGGVLKR